MSATTHPIHLEPIVSAPTDGSIFEGVVGQRSETLSFRHGRWYHLTDTIARENPPTETCHGHTVPGARGEMQIWAPLPANTYPTHWRPATLKPANTGGFSEWKEDDIQNTEPLK